MKLADQLLKIAASPKLGKKEKHRLKKAANELLKLDGLSDKALACLEKMDIFIERQNDKWVASNEEDYVAGC